MSQMTDKVDGAQKESLSPAGSSRFNSRFLGRWEVADVVSGRAKSSILVLVEECCTEQRRAADSRMTAERHHAFFNIGS